MADIFVVYLLNLVCLLNYIACYFYFEFTFFHGAWCRALGGCSISYAAADDILADILLIEHQRTMQFHVDMWNCVA